MEKIIRYKITLKLAFGSLIENIIFKPKSKIIILNLQKQNVKPLVFLLKSLSILNYKCLMDILVVDYPSRSKRFELVYCLLSIRHNKRILVKTFVNDKELMQSMTSLYKSSNWLERECWDLYGIFFNEHQDLRRILTDYGFRGFPLRKDFPLVGFLELRYDDKLKIIISEPVELPQELRFFDFSSPWT